MSDPESFNGPPGGPAIFLRRLKIRANFPEGVVLANPSLADWRSLPTRRRLLIARLDGTTYYKFTSRSLYGFLRQRHVSLAHQFRPFKKLRIPFPGLTWLLNRYLNRISARFLRAADALVFQSRLSLEMHKRFLGFMPDNRQLAIIHNGVDLDDFTPRNRFRLQGTPAMLMSASIYRLHKRLQDGIRLSHHLAGRFPDHRLHVLGEPDVLTGEVLKQMDLSRVIFHGRRRPEELPAFYAGADIMLSLSLFDPCPNVVCEALSSGLPVVTPLESGASELLGKSNKEWTIEEGLPMDYYELHVADAIPRISIDRYAELVSKIMDDPDRRLRARARAEAALDIRETAKVYLTLANNALSKVGESVKRRN